MRPEPLPLRPSLYYDLVCLCRCCELMPADASTHGPRSTLCGATSAPLPHCMSSSPSPPPSQTPSPQAPLPSVASRGQQAQITSSLAPWPPNVTPQDAVLRRSDGKRLPLGDSEHLARRIVEPSKHRRRLPPSRHLAAHGPPCRWHEGAGMPLSSTRFQASTRWRQPLLRHSPWRGASLPGGTPPRRAR